MIQFDPSLSDLPPADDPPRATTPDAAAFLASGQTEALHPRIALDPENVSDGLGKLVLTLVEVVRQVLEKQAIRRMEAGSLTEAEIERLGVTFLRLSEEMKSLRTHFGLEGDDLNLDLGPLGKLL
jgi:hypothetical protein